MILKIARSFYQKFNNFFDRKNGLNLNIFTFIASFLALKQGVLLLFGMASSHM